MKEPDRLLVIHDKLWQPNLHDTGWQGMFEYSKQAEAALAKLVFPTHKIDIIGGSHSEYDLIVSTKGSKAAVEVKFQRSSKVSLELRQEKTNTPSGLAISTAKYWLIVSGGLSQAGKEIGKIRLFQRQQLVAKVLAHPDNETSQKLVFNPMELPHTWVGDINTTNTPMFTWDLTYWARKGQPIHRI